MDVDRLLPETSVLDLDELYSEGEIEMMHLYYKKLALLDFSRIQAHAHATNDGVDDYKKWLAIRAGSSDVCHLLLPSNKMDALWHAHILDTQAYKQCNDLLFGHNEYFMHHDPYSGKDVATRTIRRKLTKAVWNRVYKFVPPKEGWGPVAGTADRTKALQRVSNTLFDVKDEMTDDSYRKLSASLKRSYDEMLDANNNNIDVVDDSDLVDYTESEAPLP